jgi:hypothetical protein
MSDELQAAIDKVADVKINPATFPQEAPLQFRHAAVNLLNEIMRLRYRADGGNLDDLDELDVEDETFMVDLEDLREFIATFHAERNQRSYAACAAVHDWVTAPCADRASPNPQ